MINFQKQLYYLKRNIKSIEYIGQKECQCILVDNPSHLYLTDDFIVTHNTSAAINKMNNDSENIYIYNPLILMKFKGIINNCDVNILFNQNIKVK